MLPIAHERLAQYVKNDSVDYNFNDFPPHDDDDWMLCK